MALNVGSRLGHYDVTALIGEGGMGQVYQATDTKLNRQVALRRTGRRAQCWSVVAVMYLSVLLVGCADPWSDAPVLTADLPLHLEDHLDAATIEGSEVPADRPAPVEWRFDEPQPGWQPVDPIPTDSTAVTPVRIEDALHLPVTEDMPHPTILRVRQGYIYVELPDWRLEEWAYVEISARASEGMRNMGLFFNRTEEDSPDVPFHSFGARAPLVSDGTVQTYRLSLESPQPAWAGP